MPIKVWYELFYPFPNLNVCTVEMWKLISNITAHLVKRTTGIASDIRQYNSPGTLEAKIKKAWIHFLSIIIGQVILYTKTMSLIYRMRIRAD